VRLCPEGLVGQRIVPENESLRAEGCGDGWLTDPANPSGCVPPEERRAAFGLYLPARTRASFRRSTVNVMPAPMTMRASVALKLPGAMQLIQVPMIAGASYTVRPSLKKPYPLDGPQSGEVNPLSFARA
jgi:hypothetical protein